MYTNSLLYVLEKNLTMHFYNSKVIPTYIYIIIRETAHIGSLVPRFWPALLAGT